MRLPRRSRESEETAAGDEPRPGRAPADPLQFADIVPAYREQVTRYGTDRIALPLGGSALVLVYRRAAFERDANRAAAGAEDLALEPPATWDAVRRPGPVLPGPRLGRRRVAATTGSRWRSGPTPRGVGDATFLARAASLGQHRDQYSFLFDSDTMAPRIDSPPFVEALKALRRAEGVRAAGPGDVRRRGGAAGVPQGATSRC